VPEFCFKEYFTTCRNGVAHSAENLFLGIVIGLYGAASTLLYKWVPFALLAKIGGKTLKQAAVR
jgi:hypothetical protein